MSDKKCKLCGEEIKNLHMCNNVFIDPLAQERAKTIEACLEAVEAIPHLYEFESGVITDRVAIVFKIEAIKAIKGVLNG